MSTTLQTYIHLITPKKICECYLENRSFLFFCCLFWWVLCFCKRLKGKGLEYYCFIIIIASSLCSGIVLLWVGFFHDAFVSFPDEATAVILHREETSACYCWTCLLCHFILQKQMFLQRFSKKKFWSCRGKLCVQSNKEIIKRLVLHFSVELDLAACIWSDKMNNWIFRLFSVVYRKRPNKPEIVYFRVVAFIAFLLLKTWPLCFNHISDSIFYYYYLLLL